MSACPCGATEPPKRAGHAPTRYRDLGPDGGSVEVAGSRQRFACRTCGATSSREPVTLLAPFRMTPRLAEAVLARSLEIGFLGAAEAFRIDERTARQVFERLSGETLARADAAMPDAVLARIDHAGRHRIALAYEAGSGDLANLYADPFDARLAGALARLRRRRLHVDHRMAGIARRALHPSCDLTIHRASAEDALARLLPACLRRLSQRLGAAERRVLQPVRRILAKRPAAVSWAEARALAEACAACEPLREFAGRREALIGIWGTPRRAEAEAAVTEWRRSLGTRMRQAFAPALSWLDAWGPHVLNAGYGKVPLQAWRRACAVRVPVLAHDSAARIVLRGLRHALRAPEPVPAIRPGYALAPVG